MAAVGGVVSITIDGVSYELGESVSYSPFATSKTSSVGLRGVTGYTETGVAPFIEVEISTTADTLFSTLESLEDVIVELQLKNGLSYILRDAVVVDAPSADAASGRSTVRLEGSSMDEVA